MIKNVDMRASCVRLVVDGSRPVARQTSKTAAQAIARNKELRELVKAAIAGRPLPAPTYPTYGLLPAATTARDTDPPKTGIADGPRKPAAERSATVVSGN